MKKQIKNLLCLILVLILILPAIFSCASTNTENTENKADEIPGEQAEDIEEDNPGGRLPFEPTIIDLGGRNFTFADCGWGAETTSEQRDVLAEEENGETINDAVYARNMVIMDMFNCTIAEKKYNDSGALMSGIQKSVKAGESLFDAAYIRFSGNLSTLATGIFCLTSKNCQIWI